MDGATSFFKLPVAVEGGDFFVQVKFRDPRLGFEVIVTDGENVWKGEVSEPGLRKQHKKLQISWEEFCSQTKQALGCLEGAASGQYVCKLMRKGNEMELQWKKHLIADDIKFQLGCISLAHQEGSSTAICEVFSRCLDMMNRSKAEVQGLIAEKQRSSSERNTALKRLEKIVEWKEALEGDLYTKFVTVLNEKKKKIRELEDEVEALERGEASLTASAAPRGAAPSGHKRQSAEHAVSSNTDSEEEQPRKQARHSTSSPARLSQADSLLLDDDDDSAAPVVPATRRGRGARGRKKTPSKPILPRVASGASRILSPSTGSVKRGASSASNRSSDNVDLDDLLDDI